MCPPWTATDHIPVLEVDDFHGLLYFESALAAYGPMGVSGSGGSGDVVLMGESFFVPPIFTLTGSRLTVLASMHAQTDSLCAPPNSTHPNGGLPQCLVPDLVPLGLPASLGLVQQAHDYLRALGKYDLAINYPALAAAS